MSQNLAEFETAAVDDAFRDQVQVLFRVLVANLVERTVTHDSEQKCLDRFVAGLTFARQARVLALSVVSPSPKAGS